MSRAFLSFAVAGTIAFMVDASVVLVLTALGMSPYVARVFSFTAAATTTWVINTRVTFKDERQPLSFGRWCTYMVTMLGGLSVNYATYALVLHLAGGPSPTQLVLLAGVAAGAIVGLVVNYTVCRMWLFRKRGQVTGR